MTTDREHNIFKPILDTFVNEDNFDELAYDSLMRKLDSRGVSDLLDFLRETLCTYDSVNEFLIDCLKKANTERDEFDT